MNLAPQAKAKEVAATGFGAEPLEKVFRLMALLDALGGVEIDGHRFGIE